MTARRLWRFRGTPQLFFLFCLAVCAWAISSPGFSRASGMVAPGRQLWQIDFSQLSGQPRQDLETLGFRFRKDMEDQDEIEVLAESGSLTLNALEPSFGLMVMKDLDIDPVGWVEITWRVTHYPVGADWTDNVNREAIMVYVFFGEPLEADHFYLPDSPRFIGLFLCEDEPPLTPFTGENYTETGRYLCLANAPPGQEITSSIDIADSYRELFQTDDVPPVTGIALEVDTSGLPDGISSASIRQISLNEAEPH